MDFADSTENCEAAKNEETTKLEPVSIMCVSFNQDRVKEII
jgi:hypothetical protein